MTQYNNTSAEDICPLYANPYVREMVQTDIADLNIYQNGGTSVFSSDRLKEMQILDVLSNLKFPMDEDGTYLYKCMIVKAMKYLDGLDSFGNYISEEDLLAQMQNKYSQFYLETARYDLDLGIKTFHRIVESTFQKVNYAYVEPALLFEIYGDFSEEANYGQHALIIAKYVKELNDDKINDCDIGYQYVKKNNEVSIVQASI